MTSPIAGWLRAGRRSGQRGQQEWPPLLRPATRAETCVLSFRSERRLIARTDGDRRKDMWLFAYQ